MTRLYNLDIELFLNSFDNEIGNKKSKKIFYINLDNSAYFF